MKEVLINLSFCSSRLAGTNIDVRLVMALSMISMAANEITKPMRQTARLFMLMKVSYRTSPSMVKSAAEINTNLSYFSILLAVPKWVMRLTIRARLPKQL